MTLFDAERLGPVCCRASCKRKASCPEAHRLDENKYKLARRKKGANLAVSGMAKQVFDKYDQEGSGALDRDAIRRFMSDTMTRIGLAD